MNPVMLLVAAGQGARLRRTTEQLPPAGGPMTGAVTGSDPTRGTGMRILVLGDSTADGVGAATHEEALVGALARRAADDTNSRVQWRVVAQSGATSRRVRYTLVPQLHEEREFDLAVVLVGVNDVLTQRRATAWIDDVAAILDGVAEKAGLVVMTGIPPFDRFPSMPRTLGRYLAGRGQSLDAAARVLCREREQVMWIDSTELLPDDPDFYAHDGFHPSTTGYGIWAEAIWQRVSAQLNARA